MNCHSSQNRSLRIALVTGGVSNEREVALAGAFYVRQALRQRGHFVTVVDTVSGVIPMEQEESVLQPRVGAAPPDLEKLLQLQAARRLSSLFDITEIRKADCVFLLLHGGEGEDGTVQAALTAFGIPFTGPDHFGCALAFDKVVSKTLFAAHSIPTPRWISSPANHEELKRFGLPCVVKPSQGGSTIGLSVIDNCEQFEGAMRKAEQVEGPVLIEEFISGREFTIGVLNGRALGVGEIVPKNAIFDYTCKYSPDMARKIFPAEISEPLRAKIAEYAERAHRVLRLGALSRIDFIVGKSGEIFCLEANSIPGMTSASLFPRSAAAAGIGFEDLCERLCVLAVERARIRV